VASLKAALIEASLDRQGHNSIQSAARNALDTMGHSLLGRQAVRPPKPDDLKSLPEIMGMLIHSPETAKGALDQLEKYAFDPESIPVGKAGNNYEAMLSEVLRKGVGGSQQEKANAKRLVEILDAFMPGLEAEHRISWLQNSSPLKKELARIAIYGDEALSKSATDVIRRVHPATSGALSEAFIEALENSDSVIRTKALETLRALCGRAVPQWVAASAELMNSILKQLQAVEPEVRVKAFELVIDKMQNSVAKSPKNHAAVVDLIGSTKLPALVAGLAIAEKIEESESHHPLEDKLRSVIEKTTDANVKQAAILALSERNCQSVGTANAFIHSAMDSDLPIGVRKAAMEGLIRMSDHIFVWGDVGDAAQIPKEILKYASNADHPDIKEGFKQVNARLAGRQSAEKALENYRLRNTVRKASIEDPIALLRQKCLEEMGKLD
jgi:hypothetical protein